MRIDGPQRPSGPNGNARTRKAGEGGATFSLGSTAKASDTRSAAATAPTGGLDALLALQMVDDAVTKRRRGVRRGRSMLDALDGIKLSLLAGKLPAVDLAKLLAAVEGRERDTDDPRLESVLDAIELRARVELAKLERLIHT
jgi:hypothetical protein